jgi:hypothetical protein
MMVMMMMIKEEEEEDDRETQKNTITELYCRAICLF